MVIDITLAYSLSQSHDDLFNSLLLFFLSPLSFPKLPHLVSPVPWPSSVCLSLLLTLPCFSPFFSLSGFLCTILPSWFLPLSFLFLCLFPHSPSSWAEVVVEYDYDALHEDELTLGTGDIIKNVRYIDEDGWMEGDLNGKRGLFPDNFVKVRIAPLLCHMDHIRYLVVTVTVTVRVFPVEHSPCTSSEPINQEH